MAGWRHSPSSRSAWGDDRRAAEIQFCNKFPQKVYVAIAYPQADQSWISRGWLEIDTGDCAEFDSALHPSAVYYRARACPIAMRRRVGHVCGAVQGANSRSGRRITSITGMRRSGC